MVAERGGAVQVLQLGAGLAEVPVENLVALGVDEPAAPDALAVLEEGDQLMVLVAAATVKVSLASVPL